MKVKVIIDQELFIGYIEADSITIYSEWEDEIDFMGIFNVKDDKVIDYLPMSDKPVVIGKIVYEG